MAIVHCSQIADGIEGRPPNDVSDEIIKDKKGEEAKTFPREDPGFHK